MAMKPPEIMTKEQQKAANEQIRNHLDAVFSLPCSNFEKYPFLWKDQEHKCSISVVIEHFGKKQQEALLMSCNEMLPSISYCNADTPSISNLLEASILTKPEDGDGMQFGAAGKFNPELVMQKIKRSKYSHIWHYVKDYQDFLKQCQIRYNIQAFGNSENVRIVRFIAHPAVPICIMLWLLRELSYYQRSEAYGFGKVTIVAVNGLPMDGEDDHDFHFSCGLIKW